MNKDQIKALLALNEEQISLLEEWNDLKNRMEKANMMFLIGYDGNNNIIPAAINTANINEIASPTYLHDEQALVGFVKIDTNEITKEKTLPTYSCTVNAYHDNGRVARLDFKKNN